MAKFAGLVISTMSQNSAGIFESTLSCRAKAKPMYELVVKLGLDILDRSTCWRLQHHPMTILAVH